jgi:hypothetical protein
MSGRLQNWASFSWEKHIPPPTRSQLDAVANGRLCYKIYNKDNPLSIHENHVYKPCTSLFLRIE